MTAKNHNCFLIVCLFYSLTLSAQKINVYKTNDLLKRIYNNSDTTYVINFWATWCKPCVAELPAFEKINSDYNASSASATKKIKVLLVTMDFKEDLKKRVIPFLKSNNYYTEVILFDEINGNDFINKISEQWSGAIPATIITKNKKQRFEFYEKKLTYEFLKERLGN